MDDDMPGKERWTIKLPKKGIKVHVILHLGSSRSFFLFRPMQRSVIYSQPAGTLQVSGLFLKGRPRIGYIRFGRSAHMCPSLRVSFAIGQGMHHAHAVLLRTIYHLITSHSLLALTHDRTGRLLG